MAEIFRRVLHGWCTRVWLIVGEEDRAGDSSALRVLRGEKQECPTNLAGGKMERR